MQQNVIIHGDHLIKDSRIIIFEKLASKKLCKVLISSSTKKITPVTYFEIMLNASNLYWTFMLPHVTTYNTYLRSFQYKCYTTFCS